MNTKSQTPRRLLAVAAFGLLGLIALWSCKLGAEAEVEEVFNFPHLADSLAGSDHAVIFLKDSTSELLDTLFNGPVTRETKFETLVARKYKGGKITVVIEGLKGGKLYYKVRKLYDGAAGKVDTSIIEVARPVSGDKVDSMKVGLTLDSVTVSPDTLLLFTGGEALSLAATLHPDTLPSLIAWRSALPGVAEVDSTGKVRPVAAGRTYVRAICLSDTTRRDSALVLVRKDPPRIQIGRDTTISVGQTLTYLPDITQDHGTITMVRWDLDGNGAWDDSSTSPRSVSYRYAEAKEYGTRFSARDSEGNDTTVTRKVRSVAGPVILFTQPA
ncbi:MAG TPA: hypothetical protein VK465_14225, partial [Fibrobacteria bacterium]|nr:hypothetical protein [Fibrobacteria bacterium]